MKKTNGVKVRAGVKAGGLWNNHNRAARRV
jgi:hypothetical protein